MAFDSRVFTSMSEGHGSLTGARLSSYADTNIHSLHQVYNPPPRGYSDYLDGVETYTIDRQLIHFTPSTDIVIRTNEEERLRITADGSFFAMGHELHNAQDLYEEMVRMFVR